MIQHLQHRLTHRASAVRGFNFDRPVAYFTNRYISSASLAYASNKTLLAGGGNILILAPFNNPLESEEGSSRQGGTDNTATYRAACQFQEISSFDLFHGFTYLICLFIDE